jgi:hypothetical protein
MEYRVLDASDILIDRHPVIDALVRHGVFPVGASVAM